MTPSMIFGVLIDAVTAKYMPTRALQIFFIAFLTLIALKTLTDSKPKGVESIKNIFCSFNLHEGQISFYIPVFIVI